jgi:hypothetical protein
VLHAIEFGAALQACAGAEARLIRLRDGDRFRRCEAPDASLARHLAHLGVAVPVPLLRAVQRTQPRQTAALEELPLLQRGAPAIQTVASHMQAELIAGETIAAATSAQ